MPSRWQAIFEELGVADDPVSWGRNWVRPLVRDDAFGEPFPYIACLVADGDRMGRTLEAMHSPEQHRTFSKALSEFPSRAREIVERDRLGSLVYAGGDDVLAFLPLPEALKAADALRCAFSEIMKTACAAIDGIALPTLSVGLGVGHVLENMGELLALGRKAEKLAKHGTEGRGEPDRDALAVIVDKRSGGERAWRSRWGDDPVSQLLRDVAAFDGGFPAGKVYEVQATLRRFPKRGDGSDAWGAALKLDVERSIGRVHAGEAAIDPECLGLTLHPSAGYAALHDAVGDWIARMLIARAFAEARPRTPVPKRGSPA